jgi:hypothetical protein
MDTIILSSLSNPVSQSCLSKPKALSWNFFTALPIILSSVEDTTNLLGSCGTLNRKGAIMAVLYRSIGQEIAATGFLNLWN